MNKSATVNPGRFLQWSLSLIISSSMNQNNFGMRGQSTCLEICIGQYIHTQTYECHIIYNAWNLSNKNMFDALQLHSMMPCYNFCGYKIWYIVL